MGRQTQVDAAVLDQFLRRAGRWPLLEIGWRTDDGHAQVRPDAHRDHVLGDLLAAPYAGVEALGDDVGQAIVDHDLDLDVGILPQEPRELRPQDRVGHVVDGGEPDGAGGPVAEFAQRRELGVDFIEARTHRLKQPFAGLRR